MSHWLARSLVEVSGLPKEKVHVVHPGLHHESGLAWTAELPHRPGPRRRLLFVGRNFLGKGGDLVLDALALLRRDVDPEITLTMVGVPEWPLPGPVPDGVDFRGVLPLAEVAALYDSHDCFVLPTRIEGFGFVFLEALSRGLPCVGRDDFAMPEIIRPGVNGALLRHDDPAELAGLVAAVLADDALYVACRESVPEVRSWVPGSARRPTRSRRSAAARRRAPLPPPAWRAPFPAPRRAPRPGWWRARCGLRPYRRCAAPPGAPPRRSAPCAGSTRRPRGSCSPTTMVPTRRGPRPCSGRWPTSGRPPPSSSWYAGPCSTRRCWPRSWRPGTRSRCMGSTTPG